MLTIVRRVSVGLSCALLFLPAWASAAPTPRNERPLFVHTDVGESAAAAARARVAKGDCAGALEAFDASLRSSVDPTVQRDRGLCHEQLGNPYPAMQDLRAYLTAMPAAADAEAIRDHLTKLEEANGVGGPASPQSPSGKGTSGASVSMSASTSDGASVEATRSTPATRGGRTTDEVEAEEIYDQDAKASPLRRGEGFIIGPYFNYRKWGFSGSGNLGAGYGVGVSLRQSMSQVSTLILELGYISFPQADTNTALSALFEQARSGFSSTLAYEARLRLDPYVTNAFFIAGGIEADKMVYNESNLTFTVLFARGRLGYRHVFGPSLGLELAGDLAMPFFGTGSAIDTANGTADSGAYRTPLVGLHVALLAGF